MYFVDILYRFNVTFGFVDYIALIVSVLNFTSIVAFCALHYYINGSCQWHYTN